MTMVEDGRLAHPEERVMDAVHEGVLEQSSVFRIGNFSQLGQVSVRTLRHYGELAS